MICAGAYTVTQADIDHGRIHDTAVATANPAVDPVVASNTDEATVTAAQSPAITVQKTAEPSEVSAVGQLVRYTFAVSNVGNVTISDVAVRDNEANPSERLASGPSCPTGGLAGQNHRLQCPLLRNPGRPGPRFYHRSCCCPGSRPMARWSPPAPQAPRSKCSASLLSRW